MRSATDVGYCAGLRNYQVHDMFGPLIVAFLLFLLFLLFFLIFFYFFLLNTGPTSLFFVFSAWISMLFFFSYFIWPNYIYLDILKCRMCVCFKECIHSF